MFIYFGGGGNDPFLFFISFCCMFLGLSITDSLAIALGFKAVHLIYTRYDDIKEFGLPIASQRWMNGLPVNRGHNPTAHGTRQRNNNAHIPFFPQNVSDMFNNVFSAGQRQQRQASSVNGAQIPYRTLVQKVSSMPIECFVPEHELHLKSVKYLKAMAKRRGLESEASKVVEKTQLVELLSTRGGTTNTCCVICTDDYESGDPIRILPGCHHFFHVGCIDKWAYGDHSVTPKCPYCNVALA